MKPHTMDGLLDAMTLAAGALGSVEKMASIAGRVDDLAAFEGRLLILRCRVGAGDTSASLLAEIRFFVLEFERFILECSD